MNERATWKPMEACPRCDVIYAKYGALVVPARRLAPQPSAADADRLARRRRALLTHGAVGLLALVAGFYAGQLYLQMKIVAAVSDAFGGAAKALVRESPPPTRTAAPPEGKVVAEASPITVSLAKKGFREQDFSGGRSITDAITFAVDFSNNGDKDIRAFDGALVFTDLLDNEILGARISISDPVASGAVIRWDGELEFNQFMDRHRRLRDQAAGDLRVVFRPGKFLYADGTRSDQ
ncbi:hypothetical protein [Tahibacter caeni]|uniref:hypothetical protein n=1 Tax=Tahibacter caeni TaxID=1453545 RepID=UPI002147220E|nr:hypothetical protein [Tahibacter caeni]